MTIVLNKTHRPLRVPLPGGKVLHLGPAKEGQINDRDLAHPGVAKLLESQDLEVVGDGRPASGAHGGGGAAHAETHGHHPGANSRQRGDR